MITSDNVKISIDNVVFFKVLNPKDAVYNIENYKSGIMYSAAINMRNVVGGLTLDEVLNSRADINAQILKSVENIVSQYGVEIKNIIPPQQIVVSMERQLKAERDKRASILLAEGEKASAIANAEGAKQAAILNAEAEGKAKAIIESGCNETVIALKQVEALIEMSKNSANKLILPNEAMSSLGNIASIAETLKLAKNDAH